MFAGRISRGICGRQCDLSGGYTLRSSGRCGLVFKLDGVGMGALNAELRRFEVSTDGHWCQFRVNRSPQLGSGIGGGFI